MLASLNWRDRMARFVCMPWDEIRVRTMQEAGKRWDLALSKIGPCQTALRRDIAFANFGRFFFEPADIPEILQCVRRTLPSVAAKTVKAADEIVQHRFDLLGYEGVDYGREIDWHFDAVHGKSAPRVSWYRVPYLDFDRVGDHKVTWELNRHQHLVTLAKAYRLTQNSGYAKELTAQWYHWQEHNPYPTGINWASSLEVAFRSLSWLWVWHLLRDSSAMPATFHLDLMRALMRNGRHIERYLSTYFAPNTHLLGEAVALFFIGTLVPKSRPVQRWQDLGWHIILREAKRQVLPDGMHFEQSTYYHVYALDFFLHARILADANGIAVPTDFDETIEKMLDALRLVSQAGLPPQFGDDDGGRVFDPKRNQVRDLLDPLAVGALLFRRADWRAVAQSPTEEMVWLLGAKAVPLFNALSAVKPTVASTALRESGIYVLSDGSSERQHLVIDAGPQGHSWAGHGHADALSIQLSIAGKPILVDPGTFTYVSSVEEREHFRGTGCHNTVQVDRLNQAQSAGPFKWTNPAHAKAERWINGNSFDLFVGSHNGYSRSANRVTHRRTIFYLKPQFWLVRDVLEGNDAHEMNVSWSFAPGSLTVISNRAFFYGSNGATLTTLITGNENFSCEPFPGWYSPRYGEKHRAPQLRVSGKVHLPTECATVLLPTIRANAHLDKIEGGASVPHGVPVQGYRLLIGERLHEIFFSDSPCRWRAGTVASDACVLYCSRTSNDPYDHFIACEATYVTVNDQRIFSSELRIAKKEWFTSLGTGTADSQLISDSNLLPGVIEEHV